MELKRLTERIWLLPYEEERDRPNLCYIRGDKWSLAVDAGHSEAHTMEFYKALEGAGLPLPSLTVLTHWHWDHSFGMHAINGLCIANRKTAEHLRDIKERIAQDGREYFLSIHETIRKEYTADTPVIVTMPDIVFDGEMALDAGNCPVRIFQAEAPHTDDSTLIFAESEKVLFLGDAPCGEFLTWKKDAEKTQKLADTVTNMDVDICLEGHWVPQEKKDSIKDMFEE